MWSIYDTMILLTGIIAGVTAILPISGISAKTRMGAALASAILITAALFLGGLRSFHYPSAVFAGPVIALLYLGYVVVAARQSQRDAADGLQFDDRATTVVPDSGIPPVQPAASAPPTPAEGVEPQVAPLPPVEEQAVIDAVTDSVDAEAVAARDDAWALINDPATSADDLLATLAVYPEFGPAALDHPNSYPELRDWITANTLS